MRQVIEPAAIFPDMACQNTKGGQDLSVESSTQHRVIRWLTDQEPAMVDLLSQIVNIDSGSYHKPGIDRVVQTLADFLHRNGVDTKLIVNENHGNILRAWTGPSSNARPILMMGHCDTVFPMGEAARRPFSVHGGRAYGPGVADMKAGLVMNSFVMAALAREQGLKVPVVALYTGDEEIASPASKGVITQEAATARAVYNAEPGRPSGEVVTSRRACIFVKMSITGKGAHSGMNVAEGRSAVGELAEKIIRLHSLRDDAREISVNVGLVRGGQSANTVAPEASAEFDVRYPDPKDREPLMAAVSDILRTAYIEGTVTEFSIEGEFPAFAQSAASRSLFESYQMSASASGVVVKGIYTMGAADSGFASVSGAPTLCAVGPVGGNYHTAEEYIELPSILERATLLARAILAIEP